jgi:hypothetical protein
MLRTVDQWHRRSQCLEWEPACPRLHRHYVLWLVLSVGLMLCVRSVRLMLCVLCGLVLPDRRVHGIAHREIEGERILRSRCRTLIVLPETSRVNLIWHTDVLRSGVASSL